ncbi:MAG: hypothetical protein ABFD81_14520 [Syntrophaceae bacterium]
MIFEAIEYFGGDGYMVFFGVMEILSDEFDIFNPGVSRISIKKLTKTFLISRQKLTKILAFFDQKANEKLTESKSFFVAFEKDHVVIKCNRLASLCDEHTQKLLNKNRESIGSQSGVTPAIEVRSKKQDLESKDLKAQTALSNTPENQKIEALIFELGNQLSLDGFPKAKGWIEEQRKSHKNPAAILHCLNRCKHRKRGQHDNPWWYCNQIMKVENGNYNERDCIREHYALQFQATAEKMRKEGAAEVEIERALQNYLGSKTR